MKVSLEWIKDYPRWIKWEMPVWMHQFLDLLPGMGNVSNEEQISLIEGLKGIFEADIADDKTITDIESLNRINLLGFVQGKVNLLLDLYNGGKLKLE